jgi:Tannase and feruloyl esterase
MLIARISALLALASIAFGGSKAALETRAYAAEASAILPVMSCDALVNSDFTALDARITATATVARKGHPFCDVKGYISPVTQFEALLPTESWRGDYLQQGCGGLCGKADVSLDDPSRTSGYQAPYAPLQNGEMAVAADDQGHEAPSNADALWARNDLRLRAVFGYSSEHQLARAMKAVIRAFYGRKPAFAYFSGVSDGGHEALVLAQRYPGDFDGIIAGAPANNWAPLAGLVAPWVAAANQDSQGRQILTAEKLPALHAAVMAACADQNGVIKDPRACTFDPASMRCPEGTDRPDCLTDEQIRVVRDEYRGPSDKDGRGLFDGGEPYGSELAWANWLVMPAADAAAPADTYAAMIGLSFLDDMAFWPNHPGKYSLSAVPFTAEMRQRLEHLGGIYNATDPNLSAFGANGGKIIIYHSWADQAIPPFASINYYRAVVGQAGGLPAAQSFSRLYMIPGLYHCPCGQPVDGDPATTVQFMPQLVAWVERGEAPGSISLPVTAQTVGARLTSLTIDPFDPMKPAPDNNGLNSNYRSVGETSDYKPGNQLWCSEGSPAGVCLPRR